MSKVVGNLIILRRGDDDVIPFSITLDGAPLDLDGKTVGFMVKHRAEDADPAIVLRKTPTEIVVIGPPADGKVEVKIPKTAFDALTNVVHHLKWAMKVKNGASEVVTANNGDLRLLPDFFPTPL